MQAAVSVELESDIVALLRPLNVPVAKAIREIVALELYRRRSISSGRAAELFDMERLEFIKHASRLGISFLDMSPEEWDDELREVAKL